MSYPRRRAIVKPVDINDAFAKVAVWEPPKGSPQKAWLL